MGRTYISPEAIVLKNQRVRFWIKFFRKHSNWLRIIEIVHDVQISEKFEIPSEFQKIAFSEALFIVCNLELAIDAQKSCAFHFGQYNFNYLFIPPYGLASVYIINCLQRMEFSSSPGVYFWHFAVLIADNSDYFIASHSESRIEYFCPKSWLTRAFTSPCTMKGVNMTALTTVLGKSRCKKSQWYSMQVI